MTTNTQRIRVTLSDAMMEAGGCLDDPCWKENPLARADVERVPTKRRNSNVWLMPPAAVEDLLRIFESSPAGQDGGLHYGGEPGDRSPQNARKAIERLRMVLACHAFDSQDSQADA